MSALTVALWGKPHQICSMRDFRCVCQRGLAAAGRKYDCLEGHPTWIGAEFLTQSPRQGVNDSIRIDAAARLEQPFRRCADVEGLSESCQLLTSEISRARTPTVSAPTDTLFFPWL
jgi:hypothetical protein